MKRYGPNLAVPEDVGDYDLESVLDGIVEGGEKTLTWRGRFIWKNALDLLIYQEIVHDVRPSLVIETGAHAGGSGLFWLDMMRINGIQLPEVWTCDILQRPVPVEPGLMILYGSSLELVGYAELDASNHDTVLVNLDSDHSYQHVLAELRAYSPLVTVGSYLIVEDGIDDFRDGRKGVHAAIQDWLRIDRPPFEVDQTRERLGLTNCPSGFLRRV